MITKIIFVAIILYLAKKNYIYFFLKEKKIFIKKLRMVK